jgi:WD40 repeat protein
MQRTDTEQERLLRTFDKHTSWVRGVDFRALSADQTGFIRLWNLENGEELRVYKVPVDQVIRSVAFCPDRRRIISAGEDGIFRFWQLP